MSYGRTEIPVVVINHVKVFDGQEITGERLEEEISLAEAGAYAGMSKQKGTESLSEGWVPRNTLLIEQVQAMKFSYGLKLLRKKSKMYDIFRFRS